MYFFVLICLIFLKADELRKNMNPLIIAYAKIRDDPFPSIMKLRIPATASEITLFMGSLPFLMTSRKVIDNLYIVVNDPTNKPNWRLDFDTTASRISFGLWMHCLNFVKVRRVFIMVTGMNPPINDLRKYFEIFSGDG